MVDGPPPNGEITEGTQSDDGVDNTFPKECCIGQDCCEGAENFNLDTFPPQCCEQGTQINNFPAELDPVEFGGLL